MIRRPVGSASCAGERVTPGMVSMVVTTLSSKPTSGVTPFEQAAGRVYQPRAFRTDHLRQCRVDFRSSQVDSMTTLLPARRGNTVEQTIIRAYTLK